jgi:hypothetical protein
MPPTGARLAREDPPPIDLREPPQALDLEQLGCTLQLREVLFDARVG